MRAIWISVFNQFIILGDKAYWQNSVSVLTYIDLSLRTPYVKGLTNGMLVKPKETIFRAWDFICISQDSQVEHCRNKLTLLPFLNQSRLHEKFALFAI